MGLCLEEACKLEWLSVEPRKKHKCVAKLHRSHRRSTFLWPARYDAHSSVMNSPRPSVRSIVVDSFCNVCALFCSNVLRPRLCQQDLARAS